MKRHILVVNNHKRIEDAYKKSEEYIVGHEDLNNRIAMHSIISLIPETAEKFQSGHIFPYSESHYEAQSNLLNNLCELPPSNIEQRLIEKCLGGFQEQMSMILYNFHRMNFVALLHADIVEDQLAILIRLAYYIISCIDTWAPAPMWQVI